MKHTETEMIELRNSISEMWSLVQSQLSKAKTSLITNDLDTARVVISGEKRVNAFELKIDRECENYIALFSPVAIDLRLVLSLLKINKTLERIGDFAEGIARFVLESNGTEIQNESHRELIEKINFNEMVSYVEQMLEKSLAALTEENTAKAGLVFSIDNLVDKIYSDSITYLADYVVEHPEESLYVLHLANVIRKVERCGDHCNNIMEEIVFYLDAKVLKHQKK